MTLGPEQFYSSFDDLYDLMIDWPKRLSVEIPALREFLDSRGARRVLDTACGTGRHVVALVGLGYQCVGADLNWDLLQRAKALAAELEECRRPAFIPWDISAPIPPLLDQTAPFDAILCLGNSFPHLTEDEDVSCALKNFHEILATGGSALIQMKNLARRKQEGETKLSSLERKTPDGQSVWFDRYYAFPEAREDIAEFHLDIRGPREMKQTTHLKIWNPEELETLARKAKFSGCDFFADLKTQKPYDRNSSEDMVVLLLK